VHWILAESKAPWFAVRDAPAEGIAAPPARGARAALAAAGHVAVQLAVTHNQPAAVEDAVADAEGAAATAEAVSARAGPTVAAISSRRLVAQEGHVLQLRDECFPTGEVSGIGGQVGGPTFAPAPLAALHVAGPPGASYR